MNLKMLAVAASFCLTVASFASAQSCDGCHRSHAVWRGYCNDGCDACCDPCCDPCCTNRYGLLRGVGRVVVGALRVVDNLIPRPCVNCACSPCCDSCGPVGCDDGCCGGGGVVHGDEVLHEAPTPVAPTNASRPVRGTRPAAATRRSGSPTPARLPRQVTAKPIVEDVELVDHEEADEAPALKPVAKKVAKKPTSDKKVPVNPLR